jgi:DNA-directed RNA polymerase subunit RPC12/RpoP
MMEEYRSDARRCLVAARIEMDSGDPMRLPYAALRLRMALEAFTYERVDAYRAWLAPGQCDTWQPRQVMKALREIDPNADKGGSLTIGLEEVYGVPAKQMVHVGSENVLSMRDIKDNYDALGAYLHLPTLKQLREKKAPDLAALRERCEVALSIIEKVLESSLTKAVAGILLDFQCRRCEKEISRMVPLVAHEFETACPHCSLRYLLSGEGDGRTTVTPPKTELLPCLTEGCAGEHLLWPDERKPGTTWACGVCQAEQQIRLGVVFAASSESTEN